MTNTDNDLNAYKLYVIKAYCERERATMLQGKEKLSKNDARAYGVVSYLLLLLEGLNTPLNHQEPSTPNNGAVIASLRKGSPKPISTPWDDEDDSFDGTEL